MKKIKVYCKRASMDYSQIHIDNPGSYVLLQRKRKDDDSNYWGITDSRSLCRDAFLGSVHNLFASGADFVEFLLMAGNNTTLNKILSSNFSGSPIFVKDAGPIEWTACLAGVHPCVYVKYPRSQYMDPLYFWELTQHFRVRGTGLSQVNINTPDSFYYPERYRSWLERIKPMFVYGAKKSFKINAGPVIGYNSPYEFDHFLENTPRNCFFGVVRAVEHGAKKVPLQDTAGGYLTTILNSVQQYITFHPLLVDYYLYGWTLGSLEKALKQILFLGK
jgi:hypothetical protein